jgi:hypothetical protein
MPPDRLERAAGRLGTCIPTSARMEISLDYQQVVILREILTSAVTQLRIESARTDTHAYRELLHARERLVEAILAKLAEEPDMA